MVIDTSAIVSILNDEPERQAFNEAIQNAATCFLSAAAFVEASIVMESRRGYDGLRDFNLSIDQPLLFKGRTFHWTDITTQSLT